MSSATLLVALQRLTKMKTIKLPYPVTVALGQYFLNSQLANDQLIGQSFKTENGVRVVEKTYRSGRPRVSTEDAERVFSALPKGWGASKIAGTFFLTPKSGKKTYEIDTNIWPLAKIR